MPALLSLFQEEWDSVALEQFELRRNLTETKQELSTALYSLDAALRVISRLTKERDEAREALAKFSDNIGTVSSKTIEVQEVEMGESDDQLKTSLRSTVEKTFQELSSKRKRTKLQPKWATDDAVSQLLQATPSTILENLETESTTSFFPSPENSSFVLCLHKDELLCLDIQSNSTLKIFEGSALACCWLTSSKIAVATADAISIFEFPVSSSGLQSVGEPTSSIPIDEKVNFLQAHPSGEYLLAASNEKCYIFSLKSQVYNITVAQHITSLAVHPDGNLFVAGLENGELRFFETSSGNELTKFGPHSSPVKTLQFGENGYWLVVTTNDDSDIFIWDLRKSELVQKIPLQTKVAAVSLDITSQLLVSSDGETLYVHIYVKSSKSWRCMSQTHVSSISNLVWLNELHQLLFSTSNGAILRLG